MRTNRTHKVVVTSSSEDEDGEITSSEEEVTACVQNKQNNAIKREHGNESSGNTEENLPEKKPKLISDGKDLGTTIDDEYSTTSEEMEENEVKDESEDEADDEAQDEAEDEDENKADDEAEDENEADDEAEDEDEDENEADDEAEVEDKNEAEDEDEQDLEQEEENSSSDSETDSSSDDAENQMAETTKHICYESSDEDGDMGQQEEVGENCEPLQNSATTQIDMKTAILQDEIPKQADDVDVSVGADDGDEQNSGKLDRFIMNSHADNQEVSEPKDCQVVMKAAAAAAIELVPSEAEKCADDNLADQNSEINENAKKYTRIDNKNDDSSESSEQEDGEILSSSSSSSEFDDGYGDDFIGDAADRERLFQMTEIERETIIYERAEQRDILRTRWDIKRRLKRINNEQLAKKRAKKHEKRKRSKKHSRRRKDDLELKRLDNERSNAMANLVEKRKERNKSNKNKSIKDNDVLETTTKNRKKHIKLRAEEIYSDDSDGSNHIDDNNDVDVNDKKPIKKQNEVLRRSIESIDNKNVADDDDDENENENEKIIIHYLSTIEELEQIHITRTQLERFLYLPIFQKTVLNAYVRIYIGKNIEMPVYRIAEIVGVVERSTVYKIGNTISNCCLRLKHGTQVCSFQLNQISDQQFKLSEFNMWQRSCKSANVAMPTLEMVANKKRDIEAANNYELTELDIDRMIEKKKMLRKQPTNLSLSKACLIKERDAAKINGEFHKIEELEKQIKKMESLTKTQETDAIVNNKIKLLENRRQLNLSMPHIDDTKSEVKVYDPFTRRNTQPRMVASSKRLDKDFEIAKRMKSAPIVPIKTAAAVVPAKKLVKENIILDFGAVEERMVEDLENAINASAQNTEKK